MPLYEYEVIDESGDKTGETIEHVCKYEDRPDTLTSSSGRLAVRKEVFLIADTKSRWGDSHATFNRGLGCWVRGQHDIDRICRERDLTPEADLPKYAFEDGWAKHVEHEVAATKRADAYEQAMAAHVGADYDESNPHHQAGAMRAFEEWMPAKAILNGDFDSDPLATASGVEI
jgi:hypothetical protein